jgi:hypothetical protein
MHEARFITSRSLSDGNNGAPFRFFGYPRVRHSLAPNRASFCSMASYPRSM